MSPLRAALSPILVLLFFLGACGPDTRRGSVDGMRDSGPGDEMSIATDLGPDQAMSCAACSNDLHQMLDCSGGVIMTCPSGQGCSPTKGCVPACEAAAENRTSIGCDYFTATPPGTLSGIGCYAAFVANTWGEPITIGVERAGATLDVASFAVVPSGNGQAITYAPLTGGILPPDTVAILFLSSKGDDCPGGREAAVNANFRGTAYGDAFHISATAPVVVYDIYPYGGGSSATTGASLLLPTSSWDKSFVAMTIAATTDLAYPWIGFIAAEDDTHITLKPKAAIAGGAGIPGGPAGSSLSYTLQRGRYLQLEQTVDVSGSAVVADKPIAVFGGNALAHLPMGSIAADGFHQQMPPVSSLASRYAGVRHRNRIDGMEESPPWTIIGVVDGTTLSYDPPQAGAPPTLAAGQVVRWNAPGPFVVSSQDDQHPFYLAQHMTGCGTIGGNESPLGCTGDPEWVNVVSPAQYLQRYVFFTDPTYPTTSLVFVRERAGGSFADVTLDCAGAIVGWQPVGTSGQYEYTYVDLVRGNFVKQGTCDNGRHLVESAAPFGLTVWGWGSNESIGFGSTAVSYAYPAGQSVRLLNSVIVDVQ